MSAVPYMSGTLGRTFLKTRIVLVFLLWDKHTDSWMIIKCDQCQFKAMQIEHLLELLYSSAVKRKIKWYYSPCDLGNYFTPCQFYIYKRLKMQNNKFEKLWIWRSFKVQPPTWQIKKKLWIVTFECFVRISIRRAKFKRLSCWRINLKSILLLFL